METAIHTSLVFLMTSFIARSICLISLENHLSVEYEILGINEELTVCPKPIPVRFQNNTISSQLFYYWWRWPQRNYPGFLKNFDIWILLVRGTKKVHWADTVTVSLSRRGSHLRWVVWHHYVLLSLKFGVGVFHDLLAYKRRWPIADATEDFDLLAGALLDSECDALKPRNQFISACAKIRRGIADRVVVDKCSCGRWGSSFMKRDAKGEKQDFRAWPRPP